jgi:hypothetical protein
MCEANKRFFLYLLLALLFISAAGVLRAEDPGPWYLISETELQSIERYRNGREVERQAWLSQASALNQKLRHSEAESAAHELTASCLNNQLAAQREVDKNLIASFNKYEAEHSTLISLKNGEIADLKQDAADRSLEAEKYKGTSKARLFVIIALAGTWLVYIAFKVCRFFRLI